MTDLNGNCPLCGCPEGTYVFLAGEFKYCRCPDCASVYLGEKIPDEKYKELYHDNYARLRGYDDFKSAIAKAKTKTADFYLVKIEKHARPGRLLDIGCGTGIFLAAAKRRGWLITGIDINPKNIEIAAGHLGGARLESGVLEKHNFMDEAFDVITLMDVIEHIADPTDLFERAEKLLPKSGAMLILTPNIESLSAKLMGKFWPHRIPDHVFYFSPKSTKLILERNGFEILEFGRAYKYVALETVRRHLECHFTEGSLWRKLITILMRPLEKIIGKFSFGEMYVIARKKH